MHMLVIWIGFATSVLGASLLLFLLLRDSEDMPYILPLRSKGSVAFGLGRSNCFPTLTFHTSWSTLENSHSRDRRKALWRNNMISRVRNHDYKESWRTAKHVTFLSNLGRGVLESTWYLVPYRISRCSLNSNRKVSFYASPRKPFCSAQYSFCSVMVGLGSEEVASLKMDSETSLATFTLPLEWGRWDALYRVKGLSLLGDKTQDCFRVEMCINTSDGKWSGHLYSAAAETDKPLLCPQKHKPARVNIPLPSELPKHLKTQRKTHTC